MSSMKASKTGLLVVTRPIGSCSSTLPFRRSIQVQQRCQRSTVSNLYNRAAPHLPRILQPELWETIIPSSIRSTARQVFAKRQTKKTNPATYFIWIYILIGSQAIRIIQTKREFAEFSRKSDLQIEKLREVIRKLQAGEEVDVEKALGTGVPEEEQAWEDALREIENEERLWTEAQQKKRDAFDRQQHEAVEEERLKQDASPVSEKKESTTTKTSDISDSRPIPSMRAPGFY